MNEHSSPTAVAFAAHGRENTGMSVRAKIERLPARHGDEIPPLEAGDRLTRDEFERRYDATPGIKKAELIEGVVHMPPPAVRWDYHASPHADLIGWMTYYRSATPGVQAGDNGSIRLDLENEPQPDAALVILPEYGGRVKKSTDGYLEGAPELVVEDGVGHERGGHEASLVRAAHTVLTRACERLLRSQGPRSEDLHQRRGEVRSLRNGDPATHPWT